MKLEWKEAGRKFGGKAAVESLSLEVEEGELLVLIGPSGCGKTTSLKMLNRLVDPTSGSVLVDNRDVRSIPAVELRRNIGYVIQQVGLFPHMTVADNIASVPRLLKWDKKRITDRVEELLDLVGLPAGEYAAKWPAHLSGGEAQRVGVARALAADPPVLLMDEPFGAVDPLTRDILQQEFLRIRTALNKTVVFVTHDLDEAIRLGDRIAVMNEGRLVAAAPPGDLLQDTDPFIRDFTGDDRSLRRLARLSVGSAFGDTTPIAAGSSPSASGPDGSVRSDATLKEALALMLESGERSIEAFTPGGRSLGTLTLDRLLESAAANAAEGESEAS